MLTFYSHFLHLTFSLQVMSAPLPRASKSGHANGMDVEPQLLSEPVEDDADSLVSSNDPDDMANEQTWPTEEEMRATQNGNARDEIPDANSGTTPKTVRKVPKGTSEYQAAWIVDESDEDEDEDAVERDDGEVEMDEAEEMEDLHVADDTEMETEGMRSVAFQDLDEDEEARQ